MRRAFDRLIESLLHPRLLAARGLVASTSRSIVLVLLLSCFGLGAVSVYHLTGGDGAIIWLHGAILVTLLLAPVFTRVIGTYRAITNYVLVVLWLIAMSAVAFSGGATSRAHYLFALVPLFAMGLVPPRSAFLWTLFALASLAAFFGLDLIGVRFPTHGIHSLRVDVPTAATATLIVYAVTSRLVRRRRAERREVESAAAAVTVANASALAARASLERASRAKQVVLAKVGQRFRFPLEAIVRSTRALERRLPSALHDHAEMLSRSASELVARLDAFAAYTAANNVGAPGPAAEDGPGASCLALGAAPSPPPRQRGAPLLSRFWRLVDRTLPASILRAPDPERRARARLVSALGIATAVLALISMPFDALNNVASVAIDFAIATFGLGLVLIQRYTGRVDLAADLLIVAAGSLGVGLAAFHRAPGDPNLAWILVMGLAPMFSRSIVFTAVATLVAIGAAFAVAAAAPATPSLAPFSEIFPLVIASAFAMHGVIHTHRRAEAEHHAALAAQRALEALIDGETRVLLEQARETAGFLSTVNHELRTPLNGVLGLADVLLHEDVAADEQAELERVRVAGRSVLRAFDTLLAVAVATLLVYLISVGFVRSRKDALGRVAATTRRVSGVNARAEAAHAELERAHAAKLVALTRVGDGLHTPLARISGAARRLREELPPRLHDHATMVARSAEQLLAKLDAFVLYTAAWVVEPGAVATFDVELVRFEVCDTGTGIAPGDLDRVFEPLYRVDASTTRRAGGTGLGLAIARRLAEGLGGSLVCESTLGEGTRMVLTVPLPLAPPAPGGRT